MCRSVLTTICPTGNVMKNGFQGMYKIEDPYFLQLDWPTTILTSGNTYLYESTDREVIEFLPRKKCV